MAEVLAGRRFITHAGSFSANELFAESGAGPLRSDTQGPCAVNGIVQLESIVQLAGCSDPPERHWRLHGRFVLPLPDKKKSDCRSCDSSHPAAELSIIACTFELPGVR